MKQLDFLEEMSFDRENCASLNMSKKKVNFILKFYHQNAEFLLVPCFRVEILHSFGVSVMASWKTEGFFFMTYHDVQR